MTDIIETREAWLGRAAEALAERVFADQDVPPLRVSVGFPGGRANRQKTVGQCWSTESSEDGVNQVFLSPIRGEKDTVDVLATLAHEMIHAIDDCSSGHRGAFVKIAKAVGFKASYTSSSNRDPEFTGLLAEIADELGPFPHATLFADARAADQPPKQGTRQLKIECPSDGYIARTTRKWLDDVGLPTCACGTEMREA